MTYISENDGQIWKDSALASGKTILYEGSDCIIAYKPKVAVVTKGQDYDVGQKSSELPTGSKSIDEVFR